MELQRCKDLLNAVIDHVSCCRNTSGTLHELLLIGFTKEELVEEFNFSVDDVDDALAEMEADNE